jgi:hypothetical protein
VTCQVTVHNDSGIAARALLFVAVSPAESDIGGAGKQWEGSIAAKSSTTAAFDLSWPGGKAWVVSARVELLTPSASGYRMLLREANRANNAAYLRIP